MSGKIAGLFYEVDYKVNQQGLKRAETGIKQIGDNAKGTVNQIGFLEEGMGSLIGKAAGIVSVGYAFKKTTDLIGQSVVAYTEFDDSLRKTGSKLNLTDVEMKSLANSTRSVALEFNSTGKAVSDAQEYLALAGYNLKEIQAASPTVVAAQRATGESMQLVSDIATDTASSYGYMANELNFVTDRMVYTTTAFNTNFAQMGEAMKYVAPVAKNAGLEFADLNAYIGVAANSGIKASQAGTALRAMFLRIQAPSKMAEKQLKKYNIQLYDNKGKFIGVNNALALMEKKMGTMTEKQKAFFMQQVFGTEAMSTANIIFKEGIDNIIAYGDAIDGATGKTSQMAKYMEAGLGGMIRSLDSEKDAIKTTLGEAFEPVAWKFVKILRDGTREIRKEIEDDDNKGTITKTFLGGLTMTENGLKSVWNGIEYVGNIVNAVTLGTAGKTMDFLKDNPYILFGKLSKMYDVGEEELVRQNIERRWMKEDTDILSGGSKAAREYVFKNFGISEEMNFLESKAGDIQDYLKEKGYLLNEDTMVLPINRATATEEQIQAAKEKYMTNQLTAPKLEIKIEINGGIFNNEQGINQLADALEERFQKTIDTSWNKKLSMEDLLINGR